VTSHENGGRGLISKRKPKKPDKAGKIHWDPHKNVPENAGEKLPELARQYFVAGRALGTDSSFAALHRFRLLTKRFRYTLELFRPCYGPGLEARIDALATLQQYLGDINDCATTEALALSHNDLPESEQKRLARQLKELAARRVAKFQRHWDRDFALAHREQSWTHYLSRFAGWQRR
jgi:CHAD domain-containing protein